MHSIRSGAGTLAASSGSSAVGPDGPAGLVVRPGRLTAVGLAVLVRRASRSFGSLTAVVDRLRSRRSRRLTVLPRPRPGR